MLGKARFRGAMLILAGCGILALVWPRRLLAGTRDGPAEEDRRPFLDTHATWKELRAEVAAPAAT